MNLIAWNSRLETGHPQIDEQHRKLLGLVSDLHDSIKQGKEFEEILESLSHIADFTVAYFAMEEALMAKCDYSGARSHIEIHANLYRQAVDLAHRFQRDHCTDNLVLLKLAQKWFIKHIQEEDYRLAAELKSKGIV